MSPAYNSSLTPTAIYDGDQTTVWNAEQPAPPSASISVALGAAAQGQPRNASVELSFGGAPGAFQVDFQTSDTDSDLLYQTFAGGSIIAVDANNNARLEIANVIANFCRLKLVSRTNAVNVTGKISQH